MGDFNIDLLKFQTNDKTNDLINCMITTGFLPVITKPSRITDHSATLIDHIYSNNTIHNYISGLIITDVSDHFGTFCINRKKEPIKAPTFTYIRKISEINNDYFKHGFFRPLTLELCYLRIALTKHMIHLEKYTPLPSTQHSPCVESS